jgi:hypothetical protein
MAGEGNGRHRAVDILLAILVPLNTVLLGVVFGMLSDQIATAQESANRNTEKLSTVAEDLAGIRESRFTSKDGLAVWQEIASIQSQVAVMSQRVIDHLNSADH